MRQVLLITGACGVGKTTLAKAWAQRNQGAIIETDFFTEWIFRDDFPRWTQEEEQFTARAAAALALEYLKAGMPVAIENVWTPGGITALHDLLRATDPDVSVKAVWLSCDLAENHRRDKERVPEDQMRDRVALVKKELEEYEWPRSIHRLDTTHLSVPKTLDLLAQRPPINRIP